MMWVSVWRLAACPMWVLKGLVNGTVVAVVISVRVCI